MHDDTHTLSSENQAYELQPGTETNIAIDRTRISRQPWPYSSCVENTTEVRENPPNKMVDRTFKLSSISPSYTQQSCLQVCYQEFLISHYGCYDSTLPYPQTDKSAIKKPCEDEIDSEENSKYTDRKQYYEEDGDKKCLDQCPLECKEEKISAGITSLQFPTWTYSEVLSYNENVTGYFEDSRGRNQIDLIKSSVLAVNVYYKYDTFMEVKEQPESSWIDFMSTIGGAVGVCLGVSILSFVELLEVVIDSFIVYFGWEAPPKKKAPKQDPNFEQHMDQGNERKKSPHAMPDIEQRVPHDQIKMEASLESQLDKKDVNLVNVKSTDNNNLEAY